MTQQEAEVILKVNDKQARDKLQALENQAKDLRTQFADAFRRGDTRAITEINKKLKKTNKEIDNMRTNAANIRAAMVRLNEASPRDLQRTLKLINNELNSGRVKRGTKEWDEYVAKLKQVKAELKQVKAEMDLDDKGGFFSRIKNGINDWGATAAATMAAFAGVVMSGKQAVQAYADMEAEMANVRKYTGMTAQEVEELNEELKKIDTRTSREDLNKLAQEAGRLGKTSMEDVLGFVRAADQINVALDDLGEGATLTLSKLTGIFGDEARYGTEQSLLKVGSVINELSQNCSASAPYLAEFASRLGGVGNQAGLSVQQIMGFAAVLDSNNQNLEASATALSQIIVRIYQDPAKYARIAGLDVENFAKLVKTDMNSALIELLGALNQVGGMDKLSPMFKDMGENGSRAISTLSTLADNIEAVRSQQAVANEAFREGISVTKEFNVQNNTEQAGLDKNKKKFNEMAVELGEKLLPAMSYCISGTSMLMRVISVLVDFIVKFKGVIITATAALVAYWVGAKAAVMWTGVLTLKTKLATAAQSAFTIAAGLGKVAMLALTGQFKAANVALKTLSTTMKASPWGLILAAITAIGVAIYNVASKTNEYIDSLNKAMKQAQGLSEESLKERDQLEKLFGTLKGATKGTKQYEDAKKQIISQYGQYLTGLINEKGEIINLEDAYNRLTVAVKQAAKARGIATAREQIDTEYFKKVQENLDELRKSLISFGADTKTAEQIVAATAEQITTGKPISQEIQNLLYGLQSQFTIKHLTENGQSPVAVFNQITGYMEDYNMRQSQLDTMEQANRPYMNASDLELEIAIKHIESFLAKDEQRGNVSNIDPDGTLSFVAVDRRGAQNLLDQFRFEQGFRSGTAPMLGNGIASLDGGDGSKGDINPPTTTDKFAAEKEWREREEALNRIAFATGQKDYVEYTNRMNEIAVDFFNKQLQHTDLSANERLAIQAQYHEALNKQEQALSAQTIDEENTRYSDRLAELRQFYIDGQITQQTYETRVEEEELWHQHNLIALTEEGSRERAAAEQRYDDLRIQQMRRRQQETERLEQKYASIKKEVFGYSQEEKDELYAEELNALNIVYEREQLAAEGNAAELLRIQEAYYLGLIKLKEKYGQQLTRREKELLDESKDHIASWMNDGKVGEAIVGSFNSIVSGMSSIFQQLTSLVQAELEMQTAAIEKRYDKELERAKGNAFLTKKLEQQKEEEIAKLKNEANKKLFKMQVIQAVAQTATNALAAFGSAAAIPVVGYILAPIAAAMAVAAGAVQIAAIKKQQQAAQAGYYEGGFTSKDPNNRREVGVVHANEFVANHSAVANPALSPVLRLIDHAQKNNTVGSLTAADVSRAVGFGSGARSGEGAAVVAGNDTVFANSVALMADTTLATRRALDRLSENIEGGIETYMVMDGERGFAKKYDHYRKLTQNPKR